MINHAFIQLVRRDLLMFRFDYLKAMINSMIWLFCSVFVSNYILTAMGIKAGFGIFILVGSIASVSLFRCIHSIPSLLGDIEGEGAISYYLTLPMKQSMVFVRYATSFAIKAAIISISVLIFSKLVMWQVLDLTNLSVIKYLTIFVIMHSFIGFFALLISAYTPDMSYFENIWSRVIFPMWFLGGYQFDWATLYKQLPALAYVNLLNPLTYILEANRAAFLGQAGYINFWACCAMLLIFTMVAAHFGIRKFMQRLDCVLE
jgi:ABC-type polysaccharide/polyol phosphate export permease